MAQTRTTILLCLLLLPAIASLSSPAASEAVDVWLPLDKQTLVRILAQAIDAGAPPLRTLEEEYAEQRRALSANTRGLERLESRLGNEIRRLATDTVWLMHEDGLPYWVAMAGAGERVHSLRISVPVVNHSEKESERTFKALSELFATLYPDQPEAAEWPGESLKAAWDNHPLARKTPLDDPDDAFIRTTAHGITSTTFGVPPDIVVYEITVRERCIPVLAQGNPFERIIC